MAPPAFDFDDQLSEDWISQPRSSDGAVSPGQSNLRSSALQSRIPLPTKPLRTGKPGSSAQPSSNRPSPRPLHMKSKSELNIPLAHKGELRTAGRARRPPSASRSTSAQHRRSSSAQSWTDGTVQHYGSDVRNAVQGDQMTPEWRRRLMKGQEAADSKDLFSPMGLENVFRPPSTQKPSSALQSPKRRSATRPRAESSMIYPSSPPPYPSTHRRRSTMKSTSPSPLREKYEHDHAQCLAKGGKCEGALRITTPTKRPAQGKPPKVPGDPKDANGNEKRVQSGTSILEHESISPVAMLDGQIDLQSVRKSVLQLRKKMKELGLPEQERPSSRSSENGVDYGTTQRRNVLVPEVTITSLADQSALDSEAFAQHGRFVNTNRGGFSSDDNFHRRPLSPSSFQPDSSFLDGNSALSARLPPRPVTPRRDERFTQSSPEKPRSSGSPLKLFGQHDTFTNNHLMRRLSQYVEHDQVQSPEPAEPPSPSPRRHAQSSSMAKSPDKVSGFGAGSLDEHPFPPTESFLGAQLDDDLSLPPVLAPSDPAMFQVPAGGPMSRGRRASRTTAKRLSNPQASQRSTRKPSLADFRRSIGDAIDVRSDGKRALYSPVKDHHAKRRRTLLSAVASPDATPEPPVGGLLIGKKRTDALPGERARHASPQVIASRDILRPRSVSSSRERSNSSSTMSSWLGVASSRKVSENMRQESLDPSTKLLAEDLASFAVNVAESFANGQRKTSVTTADFFKEANIIMRHLRGQPPSSESLTPTRRTPSGRISGDASIVDQMSDIEELDEESIRSLRSLQKQRSIRSNVGSIGHALDSERQRVSRHPDESNGTRKKDEFEKGLDMAFKNLKINTSGRADDRELPESDSPHIRILERSSANIQWADNEGHTNPKARSSAENSVTRSIRTGGSSNSSKRVFIPPEDVEKFVSDQMMGRMVFDHDKGLWIRARNIGDERPDSPHQNSDGTDENPFQDIPDLEDDEVPTISLQCGSQRVSSTGTVINRTCDPAMRENPAPRQTHPDADPKSRPSSGHGADSSQISRLSKFGSSQNAPETRATSWSTAPPMKLQSAAAEPELPQVDEVGESTEEQQLGEQPIFEPPDQADNSQQKMVMSGLPPVALSTPLSQVPEHVLFPSSFSRLATKPGSTLTAAVPLSAEHTPIRRSRVASALARSKEKAQRHLSVVKQRYSNRPVSRIDEQDEHAEGELPSRHTPETSLALITPRSASSGLDSTPAKAPPSSTRNPSVAFHRSLRLEPLEDFTFHQADESLHLDIDYVTKRHGLSTDAEIDSRFSLAVRELVARITDIEPYEPFWDYIRKLDLSNKRLVTLHMLEDFGERIEDLDVRNNELGQVNGAPVTLRSLNISHNNLTSMTAWGHLTNLHYLDVSGNQIKSLTAFAGLPHLRDLKMDDNQLTSLDGLKDLSSLLKLSLRNNLVSKADFEECDLPRLTELDLSGNEISDLPALGQLSSLQLLRVGGNKLTCLSCSDLPSSLTILDLADNDLVELDISLMTQLESLDVDNNCLFKITGLGMSKTLQSLSWRDQRLANDSAIEFEYAADIRYLALSGNKLDISPLKVRFLNLNALEMASCGIEILPSRFGRLMPNLRFLNLSHNAIKDIKPLVGIKKLEQLHLVENRVHRLRNTAAVLDKIGAELTTLDLRVNPITLGFYPVPPTPANTTRMRPRVDLSLAQISPSEADDGKQLVSLPNNALLSQQVLQGQDHERDGAYKSRLDEGTALRRRVFELLMYNSCPAIKSVNGLVVDDEALAEKDESWQRLVELKIVRPNVIENQE